MAYTTPTTITAAELITVQKLNEQWIDNIAFLANPPACRVYHDTTQTIANNTDVLVSFNSERWDTASMHSTVSNTSRITAPIAGLYLFTFTGEFDTDTDWNVAWRCYFRLNGSTIFGIASTGTSTEATVRPEMSLSSVYKLAANDYAEVLVFQKNTSAGSTNLRSASARSPEFSATWLGIG